MGNFKMKTEDITKFLYDCHQNNKQRAFMDVDVICEDGRIFMHSLVLMTASPLLRDHVIAQNPNEYDHIVIHFPDYKVSMVTQVMTTLYTGRCIVPFKDLQTVYEIFKVLEIPREKLDHCAATPTDLLHKTYIRQYTNYDAEESEEEEEQQVNYDGLPESGKINQNSQNEEEKEEEEPVSAVPSINQIDLIVPDLSQRSTSQPDQPNETGSTIEETLIEHIPEQICPPEIEDAQLENMEGGVEVEIEAVQRSSEDEDDQSMVSRDEEESNTTEGTEMDLPIAVRRSKRKRNSASDTDTTSRSTSQSKTSESTPKQSKAQSSPRQSPKKSKSGDEDSPIRRPRGRPRKRRTSSKSTQKEPIRIESTVTSSEGEAASELNSKKQMQVDEPETSIRDSNSEEIRCPICQQNHQQSILEWHVQLTSCGTSISKKCHLADQECYNCQSKFPTLSLEQFITHVLACHQVESITQSQELPASTLTPEQSIPSVFEVIESELREQESLSIPNLNVEPVRSSISQILPPPTQKPEKGKKKQKTPDSDNDSDSNESDDEDISTDEEFSMTKLTPKVSLERLAEAEFSIYYKKYQESIHVKHEVIEHSKVAVASTSRPWTRSEFLRTVPPPPVTVTPRKKETQSTVVAKTSTSPTPTNASTTFPTAPPATTSAPSVSPKKIIEKSLFKASTSLAAPVKKIPVATTSTATAKTPSKISMMTNSTGTPSMATSKSPLKVSGGKILPATTIQKISSMPLPKAPSKVPAVTIISKTTPANVPAAPPSTTPKVGHSVSVTFQKDGNFTETPVSGSTSTTQNPPAKNQMTSGSTGSTPTTTTVSTLVQGNAPVFRPSSGHIEANISIRPAMAQPPLQPRSTPVKPTGPMGQSKESRSCSTPRDVQPNSQVQTIASHLREFVQRQHERTTPSEIPRPKMAVTLSVRPAPTVTPIRICESDMSGNSSLPSAFVPFPVQKPTINIRRKTPTPPVNLNVGGHVSRVILRDAQVSPPVTPGPVGQRQNSANSANRIGVVTHPGTGVKFDVVRRENGGQVQTQPSPNIVKTVEREGSSGGQEGEGGRTQGSENSGTSKGVTEEKTPARRNSYGVIECSKCEQKFSSESTFENHFCFDSDD